MQLTAYTYSVRIHHIFSVSLQNLDNCPFKSKERNISILSCLRLRKVSATSCKSIMRSNLERHDLDINCLLSGTCRLEWKAKSFQKDFERTVLWKDKSFQKRISLHLVSSRKNDLTLFSSAGIILHILFKDWWWKRNDALWNLLMMQMWKRIQHVRQKDQSWNIDLMIVLFIFKFHLGKAYWKKVSITSLIGNKINLRIQNIGFLVQQKQEKIIIFQDALF